MKKLLFGIFKYLFVVGAIIIPTLIVVLGLDFVVNLKIEFFSENSILRILFYFWFLFVNGAYFWNEYEYEIKKFL